MTSMPASRSAAATTLAPRSWPSSPGLPTSTRILRCMAPPGTSVTELLLQLLVRIHRQRLLGLGVLAACDGEVLGSDGNIGAVAVPWQARDALLEQRQREPRRLLGLQR